MQLLFRITWALLFLLHVILFTPAVKNDHSGHTCQNYKFCEANVRALQLQPSCSAYPNSFCFLHVPAENGRKETFQELECICINVYAKHSSVINL